MSMKKINVREYRPLSNLHKLVEPIQDVEYPDIYYWSVEHAYVAAKTSLREERIRIADLIGQNNSYYGMVALKAGRKLLLRADWDEIKLGVMEYYLRQKFKQQVFADHLIATGDAYIYESGHKFWGEPGENHLGRLLMRIRDELGNKHEAN